MRQYFETIIDAQTGAVTKRPYTAEETAAHEAGYKSSLLAGLADYRWKRETGGMIYGDHLVATDPVSQTKIIGALLGAQMEPSATINWKMADGTFVELAASDVAALATAMRAHVQACFDREAELRDLINATDDIDALEAIDITVGWPT